MTAMVMGDVFPGLALNTNACLQFAVWRMVACPQAFVSAILVGMARTVENVRALHRLFLPNARAMVYV